MLRVSLAYNALVGTCCKGGGWFWLGRRVCPGDMGAFAPGEEVVVKEDRLEVRGCYAVLWPATGGVRFLSRSGLAEYWRTGGAVPFRDAVRPGFEGLVRDRRMLCRVDAPRPRVSLAGQGE